MAWLRIGNCVASVNTNTIESYVKENFPGLKRLSVEELETKGNKAFKIGAEFKFLDSLMDENKWPVGIKVRRFFFKYGKNVNTNFQKRALSPRPK